LSVFVDTEVAISVSVEPVDVPVVLAGNVGPTGPAGINSVDASLKVDKDSALAPTDRLVSVVSSAFSSLKTFRISGDGKIQWGYDLPFGDLDTNLYRESNSRLKTDGSFLANQLITRPGLADQMLVSTLSGKPCVFFGSASDTRLYRSAANALQTDGTFHAAGGVVLKDGADEVTLKGEIVRTGGAISGLRTFVNGVPYILSLTPE
jgi:hypothetical protein